VGIVIHRQCNLMVKSFLGNAVRNPYTSINLIQGISREEI
jgi:hypothetical protein